MSDDTIKAGLAGISKLEKNALEAFLITVTDQELVDDTKLLVNCHHVALDGSCLPRLMDLTDNLARWVLDYVIPRSTLEKADRSAPHVRRRKEAALRSQALEAFKKHGISGEQGELLMFVIAEAILGLPQLLCKMDLKTDSEMHFHGIDGVHCGPGDDANSLAVYWCESKVHKDISDALSEALDGLKPFLLGPGTGDKDKRRELALLGRYMDLGDRAFQELVLASLDPDDPRFNKVSWRGICLVGFDQDCYPTTPNQKTAAELLSEVKSSLLNWKKSAATMAKNRKLETFVIHIIFVPFGFCDDFRKAMLKSLAQG